MYKSISNLLIENIKDTMISNGFNYNTYLEGEDGLGHFSAITERRNGKRFSFDEHLNGLVYSLLSSQRQWGPIAENEDKINKIFFDFDTELIKATNKEVFVEKLREIKCGNRGIYKQMETLDYNISIMEQIEKDYGSLDNFIESDNSHNIAKELSEGKKYKLKQIGYALALEYLRNVGVDAAKPDVHLRRILSNERLGYSKGMPNEDETIDILNQISKETGLSLSYLDGVFWLFCSLDYGNICASEPKCHLCKLDKYCNQSNQNNIVNVVNQSNIVNVVEKKRDIKNLFIASILGGAIGDALGYTVEFMQLYKIKSRYGEQGITELEVEESTRKAIISDDTQMTLFTADGMMWAYQRCSERGIGSYAGSGTYQSYLRWYYTQSGKMPSEKDKFWLERQPHEESESILDNKQLFSRRAPGNTCLRSLASGEMGTIEKPINDSKGCGGVMRVAPVGLFLHKEPQQAFRIAAEVAAITHGHPTGYLAAGVLATIIAEIVNGKSIIESTMTAIKVLKEYANHQETLEAIENAISFSNSDIGTEMAISKLGEGWIAEEAIAIALYCALKEPDFKKALIMAVNHDGDSDSTGSICGNILGAYYGIDVIPKEWIEKIELKDFIVDISSKLFDMSDNAFGLSIKSIEISQESWGLIQRDEISKSHLKIYKNGQVETSFYNSISEEPIEIYKYEVCRNNIEEFFMKLITDVKVLDWVDDYSVKVFDGYCWNVIIEFSDESIKKVQGTVKPPLNGKLLEKMIYELVKYEKKPWLF